MGPHNWRGGLRLDIWVYGLTFAQWVAQTTRAYRKRVYAAYRKAWYDLDWTPEKGGLPPLVRTK